VRKIEDFLVAMQNMMGCCASCFATPQSPHFFFVGESDTNCLSHYKDHFSSYDFLSTFLSFFHIKKIFFSSYDFLSTFLSFFHINKISKTGY